jgi:DNA-binding sugar fermentation-stimulating protein
MSNLSFKDQTGVLLWPELVEGILVKRYKRFLADFRLDNGILVTPIARTPAACRVAPSRGVRYICRGTIALNAS